jgi:hypothetical protein
MLGFCSHCHLEGTVWRYRIWTVGLRFMDAGCFERLAKMGLDVEPVTTADPREADMGIAWRRSGSKAMVRRWLGAA